MKKLKKNIVFYALIITLVLESILKYRGVEWTINQYGTLASMVGKSLGPLIGLAFLILFILMINSLKIENALIVLSGYMLLIFGVIWTVVDFQGLELFYFNASPVLLICFGMIYIIGQSDQVQLYMEKSCGFLALVYTFLSFFYALIFLKNYSGMRMADGMVIEYFAIAIFLTGIWNLVKIRTKINIIVIYVLCTMHVITSSITVSRGWFVQACILTAFCYITNSEKSAGKIITNIIVTIFSGIIIAGLLIFLFKDSINLLLARLYDDTRSGQYQDFFKQVNLLDLLIGQGMNAHYNLGTYGEYQYIDNQFLYWMFRYGVIPMISYLIPFCMVVIKSFGNIGKRFWTNIYLPLMWLASMAGVSIYYGLRMDIAHFYLLLTIVRLAIKPYVSIRGGKRNEIL